MKISVREGFKSMREGDKVRQIIADLANALTPSERRFVYCCRQGYDGPHGPVLQWLNHGVEDFYSAFVRGGDKGKYIELDQYSLEELIRYLKANVPEALVSMGKYSPYCLTRETIEANYDKLHDALS